MKTGIYTITNIINSKIYVGSTKQSFNKRRNQHYHLLRKNKHPNKYLQSSYNLYGEENFIFEILEEVLPEFCLSQEQYWMNMLNVTNRDCGYNLNVNSSGKTGFKFSEESKLKMVISQLKFYGKTSEEDIQKHFLKKNKPKETIEEKSNRYKGKNNPFYGKKHSKETLNKILSKIDYTKRYKKVSKLDLNNNIIENYSSLKEAKLKNNIKSSGGIGLALKFPNRTHKGFKWKYI